MIQSRERVHGEPRAVGFGRNGNGILVWNEQETPSTNFYPWASRCGGGEPCENPRQLLAGGQWAACEEVAFDEAGDAFLACLQDSGRHAALSVLRIDVRRGWEVPVPVGEINTAFDLAVDPAGNIIVVWEAIDVSLWAIRFDVGRGWGLPQSLAAQGVQPEVALDDQGRGLVVWGLGGQIYSRRFLN
jgi:hypothetical protein